MGFSYSVDLVFTLVCPLSVPRSTNKTSYCSTPADDCQIWALISHSTTSSSLWPPTLSSWMETGHPTQLRALRLFRTRFCPTSPPRVSRRIVPDVSFASGSTRLPLTGPSRPSPYFKSTEDLLSKFQLLSAYDSYVRPLLPPEDLSLDKGKGKQRDMSPIPDPHPIHINDPDDDELDRRKKKNNYKHLIKGIPGSMTLWVPFQPSTFAHSSHRKTLD